MSPDCIIRDAPQLSRERSTLLHRARTLTRTLSLHVGGRPDPDAHSPDAARPSEEGGAEGLKLAPVHRVKRPYLHPPPPTSHPARPP